MHLPLSPFSLTLLTFPLLAVCCALSNANITFFGRRDKKRAYAHTHDSLTLTHTAGTHTQPLPMHNSQRHTHWGRQADATTTLTAAATQQILSTTTTTAATPILIGRRRRQQKIRTISPKRCRNAHCKKWMGCKSVACAVSKEICEGEKNMQMLMNINNEYKYIQY